MSEKQAVFFFCVEEPHNHVAGSAFARLFSLYPMEEAGFEIDGYPVLQCRDSEGNRLCFCRQKELVSYDFRRYLPQLREYFQDFDLAAEVNWHEGANAPDRVLTVHTIGDVEAGVYTPANPRLFRNLLLSLESERQRAGLDDFTVVTEATHWTGSFKGQNPEDLRKWPVPMVDIEIGSTPQVWEHPEAVNVLARSLFGVFGSDEVLDPVLCVGGVHFERSFCEAAKNREYSFGISHILPNQWLVSGGYDSEKNFWKIEAAASSIGDNLRAVVFHEGIKGPYRDASRRLAEARGIPAIRHKHLRKPENLDWIQLL
ncbi:MAG: D-aminoacyl-tRNA deacylase [Thermovirgaceae bacterium]